MKLNLRTPVEAFKGSGAWEDDSTGGCAIADKSSKAWTRQHPALRIAGNDAISDQGTELAVEHIEKYWCPTVVSAEVARALREAR